MRRTIVRFFTIADYEEEEVWLREQHRNGHKLVRIIPPCFYVFEDCEPQEVVYRLDYKNSRQTAEYMQMVRDFGWEYFAQCVGWLYFRKPADPAGSEEDSELFSDNPSRAEMAGRIIRTRMVPLTVIFLCCIIPNLLNAARGGMSTSSGFFGAVFGILFVVYVYLIVHCGIKLKRIRDRYQN